MSGLRLSLLTLGIATQLAIASPAAGPPPGSDWLAVASAGGSAIGLGELVDSTSVWPTTIAESPTLSRAIAWGRLQHLPYMFEHKGDYLYAVIYIDDGETWTLEPETRVVLSYGDREIGSLELLLLSFDEATMDLAQEVYSSRDGVHVSPGALLYRSDSGGYRALVRFAPGSLPRSEWRFLWWSGSSSNAARPDSARLERGG